MKKIMLVFFYRLRLNLLLDDLKNIFTTPKIVYDEMNYNKYWEHRSDDNYFQPRFPIMEKMIDDETSVLDIGCGDGAFLYYLKERKIKIKEIGIDISASGIKKAIGKNINAQVKTIEDISKESDTFDYVVMSEVIEHVSNSELFVKKGYNLANKALIITIPNTGYYTYRIRLLLGRFPVQWVQHPAEHLRFWTIKDFKNWLISLNIDLSLLKIVPSNGVPFLNKLFPNLFGKQIVFLIKKESNH